MNDIVSEALDRLERAMQAPKSAAELADAQEPAGGDSLKGAELLAAPAVAAAAAAAYIASRSHPHPAPEMAVSEPAVSWPEHPAELSQPKVHAAATEPVDPLVLEVEQAAPAFEPHAAVLAPLAAQPLAAPAAPPEIVLPPAPATDPLILELETGHAPPAPAETLAAPESMTAEPTAIEPATPEPTTPAAAAPDPIVAQPAAQESELHSIYVQAPVPSVVALAANPVEPQAQWVDHRPTPAPFWAEPNDPQPSRSAVTDPTDENGLDPVLAGFDHIVCLAGYGLLFASVFMLGVPALAALALAYVHKGDSHLLVRSHFRFQLRIFWTAILFLALAAGSLLLGTGLGVGWLISAAQSNPALSGMVANANSSSWTGGAAGLLVIAAVVLTILAAVWTLGASVLGFLRLIANRPIGHKPGA